MGSVPTPFGVKVAMRYQWGSLVGYNIFNVRSPQPATQNDLQAIRQIFDQFDQGAGRGVRSFAYVLAGITCTALDGAGSPVHDYPLPVARPGGDGGGPTPPQVTAAVSLRTGLGGRSFRGRIYLVGVPGGQTQPTGLLVEAYRVQVQNAYEGLRASLANAGYPLQVLSLYSGKTPAGERIPRAEGLLTPVQTVVVGNRLDTQRRRLPKEARI
ncbi:MAG TPA: hypothetical protein VFG99_13215 [Chloroflexia bacterium]|nr:hypothetical protein [Chloroflexia bacterium]